MKLFGWGKSKDGPLPQVLQQVLKSDSRNSSHGFDRSSSVGPIMPCKGSSIVNRKQQGRFGVDADDGYLHGPNAKLEEDCSSGIGQDAASCEEKLQDTIRFVFSHEQEGLLAIGTFALEQLASIRNTIDEHQKARGQEEGYESCTGMMQSSDDEDPLPRSWLAARKTCELPVYGSDVYSSGVESEVDKGSNEEKIMKLPNQSKAITLYKASGNRTPVAGVKPIVLLTALPLEVSKALDPAHAFLYNKSHLPTLVPHWTDSVAPPVVAKSEGPYVDHDSYYSSRFCGLFKSKKNSSRSDKPKRSRKEVVHFEQDDKENSKLLTGHAEQHGNKSMLNFGGNGVSSLAKFAKLWKSTCKQSSARIAPERKACSPRPSQSKLNGSECAANAIGSGVVLTTPAAPQPLSPSDNRTRPPVRLPINACSPKVAEFRRRMATTHERNMAKAPEEGQPVGSSNRGDFGHWIRTDSEFVVLEM